MDTITLDEIMNEFQQLVLNLAADKAAGTITPTQHAYASVGAISMFGRIVVKMGYATSEEIVAIVRAANQNG